jgi:peptide/nickel transport system ATP-binding protein
VSAVIELAAVEVWYPRGTTAALAALDLEVEQGRSLGIVGESGSGKTTLGRVMVGALAPTRGAVSVGGRRWADVARTDPLRRAVQMVFQDPYGSLNPWLTARQTVAEVMRVWESLGNAESLATAGDLLREVGLPADAFDRRPRRLSGGQCQRVGIARALAARPTVLVADEPTSSLDVSVQAQILNLLADLRETRELTLVFISHDLSVVRFVADETLVMYAGHVVERGPTEAVLSQPLHPYTRILLDSAPGQAGPMHFVANDVPRDQPGCPFAPRCPLVDKRCIEEPVEAVHIGASTVACIRPLEPAP